MLALQVMKIVFPKLRQWQEDIEEPKYSKEDETEGYKEEKETSEKNIEEKRRWEKWTWG